MKRLFLLSTLCTLLFGCGFTETATYSDGTSVVTTVQSFEYSYYDYAYGYPVVYYGTIPYYRVWYRDKWFYHPVPNDRLRFITHLNRPRTFRNDMPIHRDIMRIGREYGPKYFDNHRMPRPTAKPMPKQRQRQPMKNIRRR